MPTITAYLNGMSAGMGGGNPSPSKRGVVNGWSPAAVRRHTRWLYGVDSEQLDGTGYGVTLTMRDIPDSSEDFHAARDAFLRSMRAWGVTRFHWVVEWTERKRPHLHLALYFADGWDRPATAERRILDAWHKAAGQWGTRDAGQHVASISGPLGWLKYLSKHAARGVRHYQRQGRPAGWEKTGRLWGHGGAWPSPVPLKVKVSTPAYWRYRRLVRSWRVAEARQALLDASTAAQRHQARRRITQARKMLSCGSESRSAVRGVSEWIPENLSGAFLALLGAEGHLVLSV